MDSDSDDYQCHLKPQLISSKTTNTPIVEISNTEVNSGKHEFGCLDNRTSTATQLMYTAAVNDTSGSPMKKIVRKRRKKKVDSNKINVDCNESENSLNYSSQFVIGADSKENISDYSKCSSDSVKRTSSQDIEVGIFSLINQTIQVDCLEDISVTVSTTDCQETEADVPKVSFGNVNGIDCQENQPDCPNHGDNLSKSDCQEVSFEDVNGINWKDNWPDGSRHSDSSVDSQDREASSHCQEKQTSILKWSSDNGRTENCNENHADSQTTITGDVFALNFYLENDAVRTFPVERVNCFVTLDDVEECLSPNQAGCTTPARPGSDVRTERSVRVELRKVDQAVQTDAPEVESLVVAAVKCVNASTQTEDSRSSGAEAAGNVCTRSRTERHGLQACRCLGRGTPADAGDRTVCFELETRGVEESAAGSLEHASSRTNTVRGTSAERQHGALAPRPAVQLADGSSDSRAARGDGHSCGTADSRLQPAGASFSFQLQCAPDTTGVSQSWLDGLIVCLMVPIIARFMYFGMCGIFNLFYLLLFYILRVLLS